MWDVCLRIMLKNLCLPKWTKVSNYHYYYSKEVTLKFNILTLLEYNIEK